MATDSSLSTIDVTLLATEGHTDDAATVLSSYGSVSEQADGRVTGSVPTNAVTDVANASSVRFVKQPSRGYQLDTGGEDETNVTTVQTLSNGGYTGSGTTVAVIDRSGFNVDDPVYGDQVIERRGTNDEDNLDTSHGTETAETVAQIAPDANLILVSVDSYTELQSEIDYLRTETSTDVISISIGYFNVGPLDGTAPIDTHIEEFVDAGGVFATAAGNQAGGFHWDGDFRDGDNDDIVNVSGSSETFDVTQPPAEGDPYEVYLQWDDHATPDEDYDLQVVDGDGTVIRESTNTQDGSTAPPIEHVEIRGGDSDPHLRIVHQSGDTDTHFTLQSSTARFSPYTDAESVVIPATEEKAISVGAYGPAARESESNSLESFSSRGPTVDGRIAPTLVAPDGTETSSSDIEGLHYGTSYAAPHVAGIAALAMSANSSLTPAAFAAVATETATSVQGSEPNNQVGSGLINASGILRRVDEDAPKISSYSVTDATDSDGVVHQGDQIQFSAAVSDEWSVSSVEVDASTYDAGTVTLTDDGTGTYTATVTVGSNVATNVSGATVTATDQAGNEATASDSSVTAAPVIGSLSVSDALLNPANDRLTVTGTADTTDTVAFQLQDGSDGDTATTTRGISATEFSVSIDLDTLSYSGGNGKLDSGTVTLNAAQADSFSSAEESASFVADRADPTISVSSPTSPSTNTSGDTVNVTFTPDDTNDNGIQSATVALSDEGGDIVQSTTAVTDEESTTVSLTLPSATDDNSYDLNVSVTDAAGNTNGSVQTDLITVDNRVTAASVDTDQPVRPNESVTLSGTADSTGPIQIRLTDSDGDNATFTEHISSTDFTLSVTPSAGNYSGGDGTLDDGSVTVGLEQGDAIGDGSSTGPEQNASLDIDGTGPTVTLDSPSSQQTLASGDSQEVAVTVTDAHGTDTATVSIGSGSTLDEQTVTVASGQQANTTLTIPSATDDGSYNVVVTGTDEAGNTQTQTAADRIQIDDQVTDLSANRSLGNSADTLRLTGTVDSTEQVTITVTGSSGTSTEYTHTPSSTDFSTNISLSSLRNGTSDGTLTIDAVQGDGNTEASTSVTYDDTDPTVSIRSVSPLSAVQGGDTVKLTYTPNDTNDEGISRATVALVDSDGNTAVAKFVSSVDDKKNETTTLALPDSIAEGDYDARITVTDAAGNTGSTTQSAAITVDNVFKSITPSGATTVGPDGTLTYDVTATGTGTAAVRLSQSGTTETFTTSIDSETGSISIDLPNRDSAFLSGDGGSVTIEAELEPSFSSAEVNDSSHYLDTTAPLLTVGHLSPTTVSAGDSVDMTFTPNDTDDRGIDAAGVDIVDSGGTTVAKQVVNATDDSQTTATVTVPEAAVEGSYDVVLNTTEDGGNEKTITQPDALAVDNAVSSVSLANGTVLNGTERVTLTGMADAATEVDVQVTNDTGHTATTTVDIESTNYSAAVDLTSLGIDLPQGDYEIAVQQPSGDSFTSEASLNGSIDTTDPNVTNFGLNRTTVAPGDTIGVSFTANDTEGHGIDAAAVGFVNASNRTVLTSSLVPATDNTTATTTIDVPAAAAGTHAVALKVKDEADNVVGEVAGPVQVDDDGPTAAVSSPQSTTVNPGDSVTVTFTPDDGQDNGVTSATVALVASDGSTLVSRTVSSLPDGSQTEASLTVPSGASAADYDVVIDTTDGLGNTNDAAATVTDAVTVAAKTNSDGGDGGYDGGGDGGYDGGGDGGYDGGGGGGAVASTTTPTTDVQTGDDRSDGIVTVEPMSDGSVAATVNASSANATADGTVNATIAVDAPSRSGALEVDTVAVETQASTDYNVSVSVSDAAPSHSPSNTTLGTVDVSHSISGARISGATFAFRIDRSTLDSRDLAPSEVALYRQHDAEWTRLDTTHVGTSGNTEQFRAVSPGLSTFALGSTADDGSSVTETSINETTPFQGESVGISAVVNNTHSTEQTYALNVTVGDTTTERTVTVAANDSETVTYAHTIPRGEGSPELDVYVNTIYAGAIDVHEQASMASDPRGSTPTTTSPRTPTDQALSSPTTDTSPEFIAGAIGPGGIVVAVLVLVIWALVAVARN